MHLFYTPELTERAVRFTLGEEESRHCVKVLRLSVNDRVFLVDGRGGLYTAAIEVADPRHTQLKIEDVQAEYHRRNHYLHIAIAPTKNLDRLEWFLEKAVEIGIDEVTPIICARSERKDLRVDRLQKLVVSAMKQSLRAYLPVVNEPVKLKDFLSGRHEGQKFIAHCGEGERVDLGARLQPGQSCVVMIGPEGDFTPEEVTGSLALGYVPVTLGNSRLRTETAGLEACFEVNYLNR